ncbi:YihY/virulence factor BrkB family protein [Solitalea koreensis]|uniref:Membrane protein n=1 Tax=Solitalea koreensis TaxID=543615 RepID=A0A521CJ08_9SPHI|nr:YihY/virulence factor BrkB family protein [Solitalea koreensis]SMO59429.1 membrane protein [Solitalea koreensis]
MKSNYLTNIWRLLKQTGIEFIDDKVMKLSASLAYYTIFSLPPMLVIIISLCDIFYGKAALEGSIYHQIREFVGDKAALTIQDIIRNVSLSHSSSKATIVGVITLFIGATGAFGEIQDSINQIWGLKAKSNKGKRGWLKVLINRAVSFSMVISLGFILLVSLLLNGFIDAFLTRLNSYFPYMEIYIVYMVNLALTFSITSVLFAIIFKVLPDARIKWKDVIVGAIVTAVLFMAGKFAISYYISSSAISTAYGAAGSAIVILLWVYYSSVILYLGAEFTQVYAQIFGSDLEPNEYAVWIVHRDVETPHKKFAE